ncbi:hypothetical protein QIS74_09802 [Colletotrichum tabaci]|uniref:Uncharacterized protein n=1 Tax=Colletotrichum tabaci TaxID=1209068 RepID=A0AAV9T885_9PEZI
MIPPADENEDVPRAPESRPRETGLRSARFTCQPPWDPDWSQPGAIFIPPFADLPRCLALRPLRGGFWRDGGWDATVHTDCGRSGSDDALADVMSLGGFSAVDSAKVADHRS